MCYDVCPVVRLRQNRCKTLLYHENAHNPVQQKRNLEWGVLIHRACASEGAKLGPRNGDVLVLTTTRCSFAHTLTAPHSTPQAANIVIPIATGGIGYDRWIEHMGRVEIHP